MVECEETALAIVELGVGGGNDQTGHDGGGERPHLDCLKKYYYILTGKIIFFGILQFCIYLFSGKFISGSNDLGAEFIQVFTSEAC